MQTNGKGIRCVVLGANTPWVCALTEALAQAHPTTAIGVYDWRTYHRGRVSRPSGEAPGSLDRRMWVYPPGFLGRLRPLFSRMIARRLRKLLDERGAAHSSSTWLIAPYPWLAPPQIPIRAPNLVYYNLDDYLIYRPERAALTRRQEDQTIRQSRLVVCLARQQVREFQSRPRVSADQVRHFPLGVIEELVAPDQEVPVEPNTVAYVGNLGDRVNWKLVAGVAREMPEVRFNFAGRIDDVTGGGTDPDWAQWRTEALRLPNVHCQPVVPQEQVGKYYWSAAINWIPYDVEHPFNLASCPTKIMDGLASGRPVLSTPVPECLLYPEHIGVFHTAAEARNLIRHHLAPGTWGHRRASQLEFSRRQLWSERAKLITQWLHSFSPEPNAHLLIPA